MDQYTRTILFIMLLTSSVVYSSNNQTDTQSPVSSQNGLPFQIRIEEAGFRLPQKVHSGMVGVYKGWWIFITGRTNGMDEFGPDPFPPEAQNTNIIVINPKTGQRFLRSLHDPPSGLTQEEIESLSVTSPQGYQEGDVLYMTGGYGFNSIRNTFDTKPVFTAIHLSGIVEWVMHHHMYSK